MSVLVKQPPVKIAIISAPFLPQIGGMTTVAALIAREFARTGSEVKVVTATASTAGDNHLFHVVRQPSCCELLKTHNWANVVILQGMALRLGWPLLLSGKPCLMTHHMILEEGKYSGIARRALLRRCRNISVSRAVAESLPINSDIVHNPYDSEVFHNGSQSELGGGDLMFAGRLTPEKGAALLISALSLLHGKNLRPTLTIVGDGPQRPPLEREVRRNGLNDQVHFAGSVSQTALANLLRQHRILVVPSRCKEAFGLVVLEGAACGCVVVASNDGGLPEAIGPCGVTFPTNDYGALANAIETLLSDPALMNRYRKSAATHLAKHEPAVIANRYAELVHAEISKVGT